MRRDEALAVLAAHRDQLREMGVLNLSLFGAIARDQVAPDGEVDILIEVQRPMGLRFFSIELYLEEILGQSVNLVTPDVLGDELQDIVLLEAIRAA